jgi:hypothetical protein
MFIIFILPSKIVAKQQHMVANAQQKRNNHQRSSLYFLENVAFLQHVKDAMFGSIGHPFPLK